MPSVQDILRDKGAEVQVIEDVTIGARGHQPDEPAQNRALVVMQDEQIVGMFADVKRAAEETLISRLATVSLGERCVLAKQGSEGGGCLAARPGRARDAGSVIEFADDRGANRESVAGRRATELLVTALCRMKNGRAA